MQQTQKTIMLKCGPAIIDYTLKATQTLQDLEKELKRPPKKTDSVLAAIHSCNVTFYRQEYEAKAFTLHSDDLKKLMDEINSMNSHQWVMLAEEIMTP